MYRYYKYITCTMYIQQKLMYNMNKCKILSTILLNIPLMSAKCIKYFVTPMWYRVFKIFYITHPQKFFYDNCSNNFVHKVSFDFTQ